MECNSCLKRAIYYPEANGGSLTQHYQILLLFPESSYTPQLFPPTFRVILLLWPHACTCQQQASPPFSTFPLTPTSAHRQMILQYAAPIMPFEMKLIPSHIPLSITLLLGKMRENGPSFWILSSLVGQSTGKHYARIIGKCRVSEVWSLPPFWGGLQIALLFSFHWLLRNFCAPLWNNFFLKSSISLSPFCTTAHSWALHMEHSARFCGENPIKLLLISVRIQPRATGTSRRIILCGITESVKCMLSWYYDSVHR